MKLRALFSAVGLSLLFLVVYSTTNWLAAQRTDLDTWCYDWELGIPFVPLMILPYMSIDLFFVCAPFLCSDKHELNIFNARIASTTLIAGLFFYFYPLQLIFERQPVEGWLGLIFNPFIEMDQPHNLLPSLHIALRTILAHLYASKTKGKLHVLVQIWFSLIGLSTLLTHQHHVVDVIGGFALALYVLYLIHPQSARLPVTPNLRIGFFYAAGAALASLVALGTLREGVLFFWFAIAMGIVAVAYFGVGPSIYRKANGILPPSTKFVLAPILLGQHLSLRYYQRQCNPWDEVVPNVLIGRRVNTQEAATLTDLGVTAVLDLTAESSEVQALRELAYRNLPVLDLTAPTIAQLHEMADFIADSASQGTVYVHCKIGYSRSAAAVGAYLLKTRQTETAEEACAMLRKVRPSIVIRPEIHQALNDFAKQLSSDYTHS